MLSIGPSANKPSKKCGDCEHTLVCAAMTVYAYQCLRCGIRALWVDEISQWIWLIRSDCAHDFTNTAEPCWTCQAHIDALQNMKELQMREPRTVTVTEGIAITVSQPFTGTTTGNFPHVSSDTTGSIKIP